MSFKYTHYKDMRCFGTRDKDIGMLGLAGGYKSNPFLLGLWPAWTCDNGVGGRLDGLASKKNKNFSTVVRFLT